MVKDPHVILLDEPTSGLDSEMAVSLMDMLVALARRDRTVVLTIHQVGVGVWMWVWVWVWVWACVGVDVARPGQLAGTVALMVCRLATRQGCCLPGGTAPTGNPSAARRSGH